MFNPLNNEKARRVNLFYDNEYTPPAYIKPGDSVSVVIKSREQELSILAAYDYGLEALSDEAKEQLDMLIAELKLQITGS